jgi:hypothetical protein
MRILYYFKHKFADFLEYFYKLDLKCDNIDIHCIVDRRLERTYASLNSVYKHEQYGRKYYFNILTILFISSISLVVNTQIRNVVNIVFTFLI